MFSESVIKHYYYYYYYYKPSMICAHVITTHSNIKPATGRTLRPCVSASTRQLKDASTHRSTFCGLRSAFEQSPCFRSTGNVWTPAYSCPRYRRQNARVEHALLEKLTLFLNASIVLEDASTHRSNFRRRVNAQTKRRQSHVNAGTVPESENAQT